MFNLIQPKIIHTPLSLPLIYDQVTNYSEKKAIFPTPQKNYVTIFLGCRWLYFGPTNTIHAKKYQKTTFGVLFGLPPKMHYSAPQCSAMYCSVNASIIHSRWVKYDPWSPRMTDYGVAKSWIFRKSIQTPPGGSPRDFLVEKCLGYDSKEFEQLNQFR